MGNYLVELTDGRRFQVEADAPPSEQDLAEYMGSQKEAAPVEKPAEPLIDFSDTLHATGQALGGLTTTVPHAYRQLSEGLNNPWDRSPEYLQSKAANTKYAEELEQSNQAAEKSGDISAFSRGMRQAGPSLGFSAGAMGAGLAGSAVGGTAYGTIGRSLGAVAGPEGVIAGEALGRGAGALAAGYGAAYRMAGAQFLDDAREAIDEKFQRLHNRLPTKEEQAEAYEELKPLAEAFGHAEAGPEAIGNLAMGGAGRFVFGLGKKKIVQLADSALRKATLKAGAAAGAALTEFGGETATQVEQNRIDQQAKALIAGKAPPELPDRTLEDYKKALGEVGPATAATMALIGTAGATVGGAKRLMTPAEEGGIQVSPNTLPESAGLGRPVIEVIAEADALSAQAHQQAVEADSPLLAQAIAQNAAAPTPEAQAEETGTAEPSETQKPGAADKTTETLSDTEVKAATEQTRPTTHRVFEGGSPIRRNGEGVFHATDENSAFRLTGLPQIEDMVQSGEVRSKEGKIKGGRTGEVHWSRGHESLGYAPREGAFLLQTPTDNLHQRQNGLPLSEVTVHQFQNGQWVDVSDQIRQKHSQVSLSTVTTEAATPREQGGSNQHAGESRTPAEGSISDVTSEKVPDNKSLSTVTGTVTLDPEQLSALTPNPAEIEQATTDNQQPQREAMDLNTAGPIMVIRQKDGTLKVVQGHHRLARALRDKVPLQVDIQNEVSTKPLAPAKSVPERINESSLSPRTTYPALVQDIKNLTGNTPAQLQEVADALLPEPMTRPTAEKIARRLMDENQSEREANASRDRDLERNLLGEEKQQRGEEKPISDNKAPLTQGEFVTWQDENGVMREGVLTKASAGRNNLGDPMSEVTLENSEVLQVPRRELQPLMASLRRDGSNDPVLPSSDEYLKTVKLTGREESDIQQFFRGFLVFRNLVKTPLLGSVVVGSPRPPAAYLGRDGRVNIHLGIPQGGNTFTREGAEEMVKKRLADLVDEEIIHAADFVAVSKAWEAAGKPGDVHEFLSKQTQAAVSELASLFPSLNAKDQAVLTDLLNASDSIYNQQNTGRTFDDWMSYLREDSQEAIPVLNELVRQMVQIHQSGDITETGWKRIAGALSDWVKKWLKILNIGSQKVRDGVFGDILKQRVTQAEEQLETLTSERLKASARVSPAQQARAEAIKSIRGTLGTELSTGVSAVDAINGAADLQGQVPGVQKAWVGTRADFLADEKLGKAFPAIKRALESSKGDRLEGLFAAGRAFVFTDQVGIFEGDVAAAAEQKDVTPGQAAVQRVITHEALVHRGFYALDPATRRALFQWGMQNIYEGEMDAKAEEYGHGTNWRTDEASREFLLEEIMAKMIERLKAPPKSGPLKQLWDILAAIWRKLSGRSREVTLKDIQDVAKLLRTALELAENKVETRDGMPIRVGVVKPSIRPMTIYRAGDPSETGVKPWASFTPDEDTAKSYTDNPGFGGSHVRELRVDAGNVLDLTGSRGFEKLASALGYDNETAQEWKDNGWNYPWEESSKIKRALQDSEYDAVKYTDDFPAGATTIIFTRQPPQVDDVHFSLRPAYTSPLDQTLANTAKAVRLMRDGPPAVPVNLQQVYQAAVVGKSSAMVSLDDLFATAKQVHPDLTEAEFGRQLQALYDDNGAYIEPADSPAVMKESADKYNVRMWGVPASFAMVLETQPPPMASFRPEVAEQLRQKVYEAQEASGDITESEQAPIKDRPVHTFAQQSGEARVQAAVQVVDALESENVPKEEWVDEITSPALLRQLGIDKDPDMLSVLLAEAMRRGAPGAFSAYEVTRERAGRALGAGAMLHSHPRYQHLFVLNGIKKEHQDQANDIAEANADIKADEVKKLHAEANQVVGKELAESAEDAAFRAGEEGLSKENKSLWQEAKNLVTRIGAAMQKLAARKAKNASEAKPSIRGTITQAELDAMDIMTDEELEASIAKDQKKLTSVLKKMRGDGTPKAKANPEAGRIATLVNRLSEQLGVPTDITSAVEALTASQDSLRGQFEQGIVNSLVGKVRAAITPKQKPSKNLNSVIRQITRILADNLNLPTNTTGQESLGEKALDAFGRVRNNEQLIREAWDKAREQIRATLAKRATEGLEGLTEEEVNDIEQQMDEQLAAIAAEVPAHLWVRGQAFSVLRDALEETTFDNNAQILANPEAALKAAQDKINEAVEKVGNVDPARWASNQPYIIAAFNQLVADLRAAKAKSDSRRRAAQRAGVFSPAETETFNRLMDAARKRSGDKTPLLPENISWGKLFSSSPQSQEAKAKAMMEYMKADPVLSNLTAAEQQELADMFAKQWEAKRTALTEAKVAAVLKRRHATAKGKEAVKGAIPKFIQAINRGELNNDIIAQDIAEKFGFQKLTDDENKKLETLAKELQEPNISVHDRRAKTDEIVKIIARKTGLSTAEILSAWWVTSVLSGPRTIFTIGMAFLSGGFEVFTHATATVINAHLQGRRSEGTAAAMQSITNYFKSYPRAVQLAWQYVRTGDKNLLADSDPAFMQFFDTGRNNPQSIGWRMTQSKNPATRMLGRFMHFFEKMLTAGDLFNSTITRHGMLPTAMFINSKTYDKARVASETDLSNYRKEALAKWWGGEEPKTWQQQALVTRQSIDLMEAVLAKYANVLEDANFVAAQGAMTLNPEGIGGKGYRAIRGIANRAETSSAKAVKAASMLKAEEVGKVNKMTQQAIAFLYHFATHQMLNLGGLRFARFAGNKLNQSIGFVPLLGLARLYEKDYAGQIKSQAIIKNQVIGAVIAMVGITILKAVSDEPDDEKRGWGIEGSWAGLSADKIKQLMAAGRKQNSIHFGEHTFNYANWPVSSVLAAFGAMADRIKYNPKDWKEATSPEVVYTGLWAAMTSTFDTTALSQLSEILGSNVHSRDPVDASIKKVSRVFGNFAGGFVPRVFKDIDLMGDGKLRKYEGWENFAKEVPYYRRYVGGPLLDIFGKQVEVSRTPWSREYQAQPEAREYRLLGQLGSRGLWMTPADPGNRRVGRGKRSREMTDAEQKRFVTIVGDKYREVVLKHGDRLTKMPFEAAKDMLGKLTAQARDRAERAALVTPDTQP